LYHPAFLATDVCIYLLCVALLFIIFRMQRSPQYSDVLQRIIAKPLGVICIIILGLYFCIGFLDSIHYRVNINNQVKVVSVLDEMLSPLGNFSEKSYSSPFSYHLYSQQSEIVDKKIIRTYPHLELVPAHISNKAQLYADIEKRMLNALWQSILLALPIFVILLFIVTSIKKIKILKYCKDIITGNNKSALSGWLTIIIIYFLLFQVWHLMFFYHIFGTNQVGYDVFYAVIKSIRTALIIGIVTTGFMLPFAVIFGLVAGYCGGFFDDIIQYIYTTVSSIPGVLLISASILSLQVFISNHESMFPSMIERADARMLSLCAILGITGWTGLCRLIRGESIKLREQEFVLAARSMGVPSWRILWRHLLPNVVPIILITLVLDFSGLVLAEAVLSYVGVGVDPTTFSWGNMINGARLEMARSPMVWWPLTSAFIFMFVLVLAANIFSDIVRDAFDPKMHNSKEGRL
jgi:peptide/nickel transport system permease protein